jgi:hypothetical protein
MLTFEQVKEKYGNETMEIRDITEGIILYLLCAAPWLEIRYEDKEEYPAVSDINEIYDNYGGTPISIYNNLPKNFIYTREEHER